MGNSEKQSDESRFNDTLKRMLRTPPKSHGKPEDGKPKEKSEKSNSD
jgi:hypothetical protein